MPQNLANKILTEHLVEGRLIPGAGDRDRASTTPCCRTRPAPWPCSSSRRSVWTGSGRNFPPSTSITICSQTDFKNADDHRYLQTASARFGIHFSRPGNGISHQVHMERFGRPGLTMLGADSHTPGAAGVSMLAIGAGGLDVALAMAGYPYYLPCPKRVRGED